MLSSILVIAAIGALVYGYNRWKSLPANERADFSKKALIYGTAAAVLVLVLTGRAHWLMGVLAALLAAAGRIAQLAQFIPLFKKIIGDDGGSAQSGSVASTMENMSKQEAADILGVSENAEPDDIRVAHKRLMQKIHPDRGGSDALAKQINKAKDVLLS